MIVRDAASIKNTIKTAPPPGLPLGRGRRPLLIPSPGKGRAREGLYKRASVKKGILKMQYP
ncbi:MAG: hypothetical protein CTY19_00220 [Methylomonas sp.]|nr:MAG: hypothetical protein CTY19_00220 [Methylomonas sp.]